MSLHWSGVRADAPPQLYHQSLTQLINQILTEEDFISAFLHISDTESTFADHMELDSYFRRQAARRASKGMGAGMIQLVRSLMDLTFGFVEMELRNWVDAAVERNTGSVCHGGLDGWDCADGGSDTVLLSV
jgi:hypothetical protein